MASTINAKNTSTGVVITPDSSGQLELQTADTTRMTITSGGNVGIGTSSPISGYSLTTQTPVYINNQSTDITPAYANWAGTLTLRGNAYNGGISLDSTGMWIGNNSATRPIIFATGTGSALAERMRIDSSGNAFIGCTTTANYTVRLSLSQNSGTNTWCVGPSASSPANFYVAATASTGVYLNGTAATAWSSASDERLKENLVPIENAIEKVTSLRTVIGNFIADEEKTKKAFLIAQDVENVLPEAVSINKTEDGNEYLGLAYTDVIPLLTAAIKEQQELIKQLQADVAALKGA